MKGEDIDRKTRFEDEGVKRHNVKKIKSQYDEKKDELGHKRYGIDMKATEKRINELKQ